MAVSGRRKRTRLFVMPCAGIDNERTVFYRKDESVHPVYSDAPFPGTVALERFWFANAAVSITFNALKKVVDSLERFLVAVLPARVFLPRSVIPKFSHATDPRRLLAVRRGLALGIGSSSSTSIRSW